MEKQKEGRGPKREKAEKKNRLSAEEIMDLLTEQKKTDRKIKEELEGMGKSFVALILIRPEKYQLVRGSLLKFFSGKENLPGIFVTTNMPYGKLVEELEKQGTRTDKIKFIDLISRIGSYSVKENINADFLEAPTELTELMLSIEKSAKQIHGKKFLIIDSVSTLLIYNEAPTIEKFLHSLIGKLSTEETKTALLVSESEETKAIVHTISHFCDKVVRVQ